MAQSIAEVVDRAQYVRHDEERGLLVVWHGGYTINVHDAETGHCRTCWTLAMHERHSAPPLEKVIESIESTIESGDYP